MFIYHDLYFLLMVFRVYC